ncbi:elongation factor P hydroxylase [Halomonas sp.]|uniref:elongation factor P hydroxylase n=1 Tax=Halomonas sp. TaxID=1486246 RepID=UPI003567B39B
MSHRLEDVIALFDGLFDDTYHTRLVRGDADPLYLPADDACPWHRVIFAHGFYASALHEISHWCIAGARRRGLEDYGYWYLPDGRDPAQQDDFEAVEVTPQALESLFSCACGLDFHVSVDNLGGEGEVDRDAFRARVEARASRFEEVGLPRRAAAFRATLKAFYRDRRDLDQSLAAGRTELRASRLAMG